MVETAPSNASDARSPTPERTSQREGRGVRPCPISDCIGPNVTVLSYLDTVGFGFVTYAELVPDLWDIAEEIDEPLKELEKAGSGSSRVVARR